MTVTVRPYTKHGRTGWEVDIRGRRPDGTLYRDRKKAPVTSRSAAKRWGEERERAILFGEDDPGQAREIPTLGKFAPRFLDDHARANRNKASSIDSQKSIIRNHLDPTLGDLRLDQIDDAQVQRLKRATAHLSPKTANNILSTLRTMLRVAVDWKEIDAMPCTIRLNKTVRDEAGFYSFEEYDQIIEAARALGPASELLVRLGAEAGLRLGEILALEWRDVDLDAGRITIRHSDWRGIVSDPKGRKVRRLPLTDALATALRAHVQRDADSRVFLHGDSLSDRKRKDPSEPLSKKVAQKWMRAILVKAGLPTKETGRIHVLRHTFCSHLAMQGASPIAIQEAAGHASVSTTQRYLHLSGSHLDQTLRLLDARPRTVATASPESGDTRETPGTSGETLAISTA